MLDRGLFKRLEFLGLERLRRIAEEGVGKAVLSTWAKVAREAKAKTADIESYIKKKNRLAVKLPDEIDAPGRRWQVSVVSVPT